MTEEKKKVVTACDGPQLAVRLMAKHGTISQVQVRCPAVERLSRNQRDRRRLL